MYIKCDTCSHSDENVLRKKWLSNMHLNSSKKYFSKTNKEKNQKKTYRFYKDPIGYIYIPNSQFFLTHFSLHLSTFPEIIKTMNTLWVTPLNHYYLKIFPINEMILFFSCFLYLLLSIIAKHLNQLPQIA